MESRLSDQSSCDGGKRWRIWVAGAAGRRLCGPASQLRPRPAMAPSSGAFKSAAEPIFRLTCLMVTLFSLRASLRIVAYTPQPDGFISTLKLDFLNAQFYIASLWPLPISAGLHRQYSASMRWSEGLRPPAVPDAACITSRQPRIDRYYRWSQCAAQVSVRPSVSEWQFCLHPRSPTSSPRISSVREFPILCI